MSDEPEYTPDDAEVLAGADLVGRAGGRSFEVGYLHEDVPSEEAAWYAHAQFRGHRLTAENHRSPGAAARALAETVLRGGKCRCGRLVALSNDGAIAYEGATLDGQRWTSEQAAAAGQCRWRLVLAKWVPSCDAPPVRLPRHLR